jgi:NADP-reducing hydrogenase subunit HndB
MPAIKSLDDLRRLKQEALEKRQARATTGQVQITVAMGTCGIAAGARETMKAILEHIETNQVSGVVVTQTGCIGKCDYEPIVEVSVADQPKVTYGKINGERARKIMQNHIGTGAVVEEWVVPV